MATTRNLPPPQSPFVDKSTFNLSYDGYQFLINLLNVTTSALLQQSVASGLQGGGNTQATALLLSNQLNVFDVVPAGSGALLSVFQTGQAQLVFNRDPAAVLSVYPPPGSRIDDNPNNVPYPLPAKKMQTFWTASSTQIFSTQFG